MTLEEIRWRNYCRLCHIYIWKRAMAWTLWLVKVLFVILTIYGIIWFLRWSWNIEGEAIVYAAQHSPMAKIPQVGKVVYAIVTAYTSSVDETDETPFITASGDRTGHGVVACPSKYPFGTEVEIAGERYICKDRMNGRYRREERFDIWMEKKSDAFAWGIKRLEISID